MRPLCLSPGPRRALLCVLGLLLPFLAGCESGALATKQRVYVDAISVPAEVLKEVGSSYQLTAKRSMVAGQQANYTAAQLAAYRSGERKTDGDTQIMRNVAARLTDDEIKAVASYIQGLQ